MRLLKDRFLCLKFIYLNDSLINGNIKEFEKFCDLVITQEININWGGHTLIRKEMDSRLISKMKRAGAQRLNFGIESGSDKVLKLMRKSFDCNLALRVLKDIRNAGISFSVNLIIGHPGETYKEFNETVAFFCKLQKLTDCIHINPCLVLKGSSLYNNYDDWGIVLPGNYVTEWHLSDGSNDLETRLKRIAILKNI
jgi:radical SAM superfamily enzyme YgiQ (UPF0313 family)